VATYLDAILEYHRGRVATDSREIDALEEAAMHYGHIDGRDFAAALRAEKRTASVAVIAELKRRSPSKGELATAVDSAEVARAYERGGASCLSVLTDEAHFGGSRDDLMTARAATALPVLRKDFTVSRADIFDACLMGADAVLLIVAALNDDELALMIATARRVGLASLVEVHDEIEVLRALDAGAEIIGVNQRDLHTFAVDTDRAVRVAATVPAHIVTVAESGISRPDQVARLATAGFDAILVGEALVTATDPAAELVRLLEGVRSEVRAAVDPAGTSPLGEET
jgi:indole-3-glycerol phosphate synthase